MHPAVLWDTDLCLCIYQSHPVDTIDVYQENLTCTLAMMLTSLFHRKQKKKERKLRCRWEHANMLYVTKVQPKLNITSILVKFFPTFSQKSFIFRQCLVSPTCCTSCLSSVPPVTPGSPSLSEAGSDSVHTDVDDQRSSVSEPHRESSKSSNNNSANAAGHNMPPYEELTPIYIIKNLVVKPVSYPVTDNNLLFQEFTLLHNKQRFKLGNGRKKGTFSNQSVYYFVYLNSFLYLIVDTLIVIRSAVIIFELTNWLVLQSYIETTMLTIYK